MKVNADYADFGDLKKNNFNSVSSVSSVAKSEMMKRYRKQFGFTLVELMIALLVSSVVLAAVATLSHATACADESTDAMGREQARLRYVNIRLTDLVQRANRVTAASSTGFELWHDADADGTVDSGELTQVACDTDGSTLIIGGSEEHSQCENLSFAYDAAAPLTRFIAVGFDLTENGSTQHYSVNAKLRVSDDY